MNKDIPIFVYQFSGAFEYQFTEAGNFYYWSDYMDQNLKLAIRGKITVTERTAVTEKVSLHVNGFNALYVPRGKLF